MIIPERIVRVVTGAPRNMATIQTAKFAGGGSPVCVMVSNEMGLVVIADAFKVAIESAEANGDKVRAEAWASCIATILQAYTGSGPRA